MKIEINHGNSILSLFYHRQAIYVVIQLLAINRHKTMRHEWPACGKTMIKWSFHGSFLNNACTKKKKKGMCVDLYCVHVLYSLHLYTNDLIEK